MYNTDGGRGWRWWGIPRKHENPVPSSGVAEEAIYLEDDLIFDDGLDEVLVLEKECRDAITEMLDEVEPPAVTNKDPADRVEKFEPTVEYSGNLQIYANVWVEWKSISFQRPSITD